jgi:hypothetical protein
MSDSHKSASVFFLLLGVIFLIGAQPGVTGAVIGLGDINYGVIGSSFSGLLVLVAVAIYVHGENQKVRNIV